MFHHVFKNSPTSRLPGLSHVLAAALLIGTTAQCGPAPAEIKAAVKAGWNAEDYTWGEPEGVEPRDYRCNYVELMSGGSFLVGMKTEAVLDLLGEPGLWAADRSSFNYVTGHCLDPESEYNDNLEIDVKNGAVVRARMVNIDDE